MSNRSPKYRSSYRTEIVDAFKQSGLTQKEFSRQRGINPHTLQYFLQQERKHDVSPTELRSGFAKVVRKSAVSSLPTPQRITVSIHDAIKIETDTLPSPSWLASLQQALATSC